MLHFEERPPSVTCKLCDRFWKRVSEQSDAWERACSNESELWSEETDKNRELIEQAFKIQEADPAAALQLRLQAAEAGSAWAMEMVGWHYHTGIGVAVDLRKAGDYYHRAICAGSWMATLHYARVLAELGYYDECESVLKDGVQLDSVPAYYWLAWFRYKRSHTADVRQEVRPMLEYAADQGHLLAKIMLSRWMFLGKFGCRNMFGGLILAYRSLTQIACEESNDSAAGESAEMLLSR